MAYVFFLIGLLCVLGGGAFTFSLLSVTRLDGSGVSGLATVLAIMPGLGTVLTGLLLLALGEALVRLANIDRQSRRAARAAEWTASQVERQDAG